MQVFDNDDQAEDLEKQVMNSNLSDHNKILVIRCIEKSRSSYNSDQIHYREIVSPKIGNDKPEYEPPLKYVKETKPEFTGPSCTVRGLS